MSADIFGLGSMSPVAAIIICLDEQIVVVLPPFFITSDAVIPIESTLEIRRSRISAHDLGISKEIVLR